MDLDIKAALAEVLNKSDPQLEEDTALKWAARCIACCITYKKTKDRKWLIRADNYRQEALEHAALVRDKGDTVRKVETEIENQAKALFGIES